MTAMLQASVSGAWIKLALLANGLTTSDAFDTWFAGSSCHVRRRNFYNSPDWRSSRTASLPQEIRLTGGDPVTVAVNCYGKSPWMLHWTEHRGPHIVGERLPEPLGIELPLDLTAIRRGHELPGLCNLYGGSALSFFSPRACYFFADGAQCRFCSLEGTARENDQFASTLSPAQVDQAVTAVLELDARSVTQVMIVGGNDRNLDRGFRNHLALIQAASHSIERQGLGQTISVHLITMPPWDLGLVDEVASVPNVHVGFNLEVWDSQRFIAVAPGKAADYGHAAILSALHRLRDAIGPYRAHSILIAGLESPGSTLAGALALATDGISPIINVYHSDRHSLLGLTVRPPYGLLAEVASGLQRLHDRYPIQPYWKGCGRNALDYEASHGMFRGEPPDLT